MRHSKALLALSTLLFTAVAHATASSSSSSSNPLAERDSFPELLKRHGGDVYSCSSSSYHLVHSSGNGCACKSSVRNGETKCPPPKKGHCGVSKCSSGKGCVIECNGELERWDRVSRSRRAGADSPDGLTPTPTPSPRFPPHPHPHPHAAGMQLNKQ